ncbi:MAG: DUF4268 domain-containing protein [Candidatus Micrarchaeaceae archaeon]
MKNIKLGEMKTLDLRKVWQNEEQDFSKWLSDKENIALLSKEIGVDIKVIDTEAKVGNGNFEVDILAEEEGGGRKIIIENQLENTNHEHLGKLITYASGYDADIIIWIFKDIREEHRRAIDWLNENSSESAFFGIKLEVWQIDSSAPAPKFQIISKPNEWAKILKQSKGSDKLPETKLKQLDFWTQFKVYIQKRTKISLRTPRPQHWYDISLGSADAKIELLVNTRDEKLGCEIYILNNKKLFEKLKKNKTEIEKKLGLKLDWRVLNTACKIGVYYDGFDINDNSKMEEYFDWLSKTALSFHKIFGAAIKKNKKVLI